ncbi:O-methyltransferase [Colletotrichum tofieldiae]|uniref:O-methyltransferase n=1 Tax=Colletotrichum tofieldiae TaxID=708197 RepID=A0A161WLM2_9PEZI|nr:O-methyltransferase [Colletotrichum tofieldiae]GKT62234.1 O-methyltransferase [Colletotrichum tofieldiae]GKT69718.1 O-methyltransferase [Colletotrichum tofieldiae]
MNKLKLSSWLGAGSSSDAAEGDEKKQNRRSFSPFSTRSSDKLKDETPSKAPLSKDASTTTESPVSSPSRLTELAKKIAFETEKLEKYMKENNLPMPTLDPSGPGDFPKLPDDIQKSRMEIIYATRELGALAHGPREDVRWKTWSYQDSLSLQLVNHFGLAKLVPIDGTITLTELQPKTTLDPVNLARILRHVMTNRIFREPSPGVIAHTAASRLLAEDQALQDWVGYNLEDNFPASAHVLQALKTHPEATSLTRTGFNFAFDTVDKEPMFVTFGKDPARAKRFGGAMLSLTGGEGYEVKYLVDSYDFSDIDAKGGTLVDVGGSHGFVCVDLAKKWKKMKFVVQDLPKTVDSTPKPICEDAQVAERIETVAHDFFQEQTVKDADVYFFRWIIHNYSTPYAVSILKNLVPALKPGAKVVIKDHCLREPGQETPWDERIIRSMDMVMLAVLNAQERNEDEYRELFKAADERYVFKGVMRPKGCRMSIIEAVWDPEGVEKGVDTEAGPKESIPGGGEGGITPRGVDT